MAHYKGAANEATRAMHIMKKREKAREKLELKKRKIEEDLKLSTIDSKFATHHDAIETQLRSSTVGLVTLDQMRQRQVNAVKERELQLAHKEEEEGPAKLQQKKTNSLKGAGQDVSRSKALSFGYDDDEDDDNDDDEDSDDDVEEKVPKVANDQGREPAAFDEGGEDGAKIDQVDSTLTETDRLQENSRGSPTHGTKISDGSRAKRSKLTIADLDVDTSFLPDREREEEERRLRERLAAEWHERQRKLKEEEIEITFSYWDGSGHRRVVRMKKGNSIYQFLQACLETLRKDFNELRSVSADQLMYVKEDLIIPHHYTFYDFIVTKARGKSGPLFSFDVHEDVRLIADATVEKDESHAGKVLLRSWYERNKHIFPASRWEPYDPTKTYEKYTISDKRSK